MQYSELEIVRSYKQNPTKTHIQELADLNDCKKTKIEYILKKHGALEEEKEEIIKPPNYQKPPYAVIMSINIRIGSLKDQISTIREDMRRKDQMITDCQNEITVLSRYLEEIEDDSIRE